MQSVNSPPSCPPWWYYAEVNAHYILMSRDHHDYHLCHLSMCTVVQVYIQGLLPSMENIVGGMAALSNSLFSLNFK